MTKENPKIIPFTEEELKNEVWKQHHLYYEYSISSLGRVKGPYIRTNQTDGTLIPSYNTKGYARVNIKGKTRVIHRLVALHFLENDDPENKTYVNHKDGNPSNNRVENLEWCTPSYNVRHALEMGFIKSAMKVELHNRHSTKTLKFNSVKELSEYLRIPRENLWSKIKHSDKFPILDKYTVRIPGIKEAFLDKNVEKHWKDPEPLWVYDYIHNTWDYYKYIAHASYETGISSVNIRTCLRRPDIKDHYMPLWGYGVYKEKIDITPITDKDKIEDLWRSREKMRMAATKEYVTEYLLYDYDKRQEMRFDVFEDLHRYLCNIEPLDYQPTDSVIAALLGKVRVQKKTWIIKGLGLSKSDYNLPWFPYSERVIICSKHNMPLNSLVFKLEENGIKKLFIGWHRLAAYLFNVSEINKSQAFQTFGTMRRIGLNEYVKLTKHKEAIVTEIE